MTRKRARRPNDELIAEVMSSPCVMWPDCCYLKLLEYRSAVDKLVDPKLPAPTMEEIDGLRLMIFCTLSCIAKNCPEKAYRMAVTLELLKPVYNEPRRECRE
jgi:hypothetical protein